MEVGKCVLNMLPGPIDTKGAQTMCNIPEDADGGVCRHGRLAIIDVAPTDAKMNVE